MLTKFAFSVVLGLVSLGACSPTVDPTTGTAAKIALDGSIILPLASIYDDGTDRLFMNGTMKAYRTGKSYFTQSSSGGFSCTGETDETWTGRQTCSDGSVFAFSIPEDQRGKLSGGYLLQDGGARIAVGWGHRANEASLAAMLDR